MRIQGHSERTGDAKLTRGHHLSSRFVLHTVGPIVAGGDVRSDHEQVLTACYESCLDVAEETGVRSVAFCGISTGLSGYPKDDAARTAVKATTEWLHRHPGGIDWVVFDVFADDDRRAYDRHLSPVASPSRAT